MRAHPRRRGAIGVGVVVLCALAAAVALTVHGVRERDAATVADGVPEDLFWPWILSCTSDLNRPIINLTYGADGVVDLSVGMVDTSSGSGQPLVNENGEFVVDEPASRALESCLSAHHAEMRPPYRPATDAERLLIYDWTIEWQAPCLAARRYGADVPAFERFVDRDDAPWYLLGNRDWLVEDVDFDALLAARHACAPVPPFLAADGVGW